MTRPLSDHAAARLRLAAVALALSALLFATFPLVRPFFPEPAAGASQSDIAAAADGLASRAWVISHLLAGAGFLALIPGLTGIWAALAAERLEGRAFAGLLLAFAGTALLLIILGAETFGLSAAGRAFAAGEAGDLAGLVERVRTPVLFAILLAGLLLLAAGSIVLATAIRRSDRLPHWGGIALAAGLTLWMPLLPQAARIVDGLTIGLAGCWLALGLWRISRYTPATEANALPREVTEPT
jgi:hypothetical protein